MANKTIPDLTAAESLDGTELYEASQSGVSVKVTGDAVRNGKVKVYRALLSQSGTDAPVATVLENTLGGEVVWTRTGPGVYRGRLNGAFAGHVLLSGQVDYWNGSTPIVNVSKDGANDIYYQTLAVSGVSGLTTAADINDGGSGASSIEILVYP